MTSALPPDPWKALGVERDADKTDIRAAYKKLVLKCHPDKVQDPTLKQQKVDEFQKVQQAYELLNNDAEKAKYEQKLRLAELRAAKVEQDVKSAPNISVPRSSSKYAATYDVRPSEPTSRHKSSPTSGKVYTHYTSTHTRSHEEMPSQRTFMIYEESDKHARRAASYEKYEKPSKRDDERRDRDKAERRRRREEEELARFREKDREDRDREKEKDREARKAEKKRLDKLDKEREKERRRDAEDKSRRHKSPYVEEPYAAEYMAESMFDDEKYGTSTSRSEKKRSSSRKKGEGRDRERERDRDRERERERDKSTSRRTKSPNVNAERKHVDLYEHAASYIGSQVGSLPTNAAAFWKSDQTPPDPSFLKPDASYQKPLAPTPPPVDPEEESIRRSSARAATRRSSNDAARSKGDLRFDFVQIPTGGRPIPGLKHSYSTPPPVPESPPRVSRAQTTHEAFSRPIPTLSRNKTWAAGGVDDSRPTADYAHYEYESDDDRERRHRHRSHRHRSPSTQATHRYKIVDIGKTAKLEQYTYTAAGSPTSTRRYVSAADIIDPHGSHSPGSTTYHGATVFRHVKEGKKYGPSDVKYTEYSHPAAYYEQSSYGVTTAGA